MTTRSAVTLRGLQMMLLPASFAFLKLSIKLARHRGVAGLCLGLAVAREYPPEFPATILGPAVAVVWALECTGRKALVTKPCNTYKTKAAAKTKVRMTIRLVMLTSWMRSHIHVPFSAMPPAAAGRR